jgi:hypothetical protein
MLDSEIRTYYDRGEAQQGLVARGQKLELARGQGLRRHYLPEPPAAVLDVGSGSGGHAGWLARDLQCGSP